MYICIYVYMYMYVYIYMYMYVYTYIYISMSLCSTSARFCMGSFDCWSDWTMASLDSVPILFSDQFNPYTSQISRKMAANNLGKSDVHQNQPSMEVSSHPWS